MFHAWAETKEQIRTLTTTAELKFPKEEKNNFPEAQTLSWRQLAVHGARNKILCNNMYILEFSVRLLNVHPKYPKMFSWGGTKKKHVIHLWDGPKTRKVWDFMEEEMSVLSPCSVIF